MNGVKNGGASYENGELGYVIINTQGDTNFIVAICVKLPCNEKTQMATTPTYYLLQ